MRIGRGIVLGLLLTMAAAGCGQADGGTGVATANGGVAPSSSANSGVGIDEDAALRHAQCMREHGMDWFPDPKAGGQAIEIPKGADHVKVDAAMAACQKYAPNGGQPPKMDPQVLEQVRQMAKCMRENGVPDFPDPDPNGSLIIERKKGAGGVGPGDPAFDAAEKTCARFRPSPPPGAESGVGPGGGPGEQRRIDG